MSFNRAHLVQSLRPMKHVLTRLMKRNRRFSHPQYIRAYSALCALWFHWMHLYVCMPCGSGGCLINIVYWCLKTIGSAAKQFHMKFFSVDNLSWNAFMTFYSSQMLGHGSRCRLKLLDQFSFEVWIRSQVLSQCDMYKYCSLLFSLADLLSFCLLFTAEAQAYCFIKQFDFKWLTEEQSIYIVLMHVGKFVTNNCVS